MVDFKPNYCDKCLFGKSGKKCSLLLQNLNDKDRWDCIDPLEECPLVSLNSLTIKTEVKRGFYDDDKLKVSLILDDEVITSDEFVYKEYCGSDDD
jgi:hypothetical protein